MRRPPTRSAWRSTRGSRPPSSAAVPSGGSSGVDVPTPTARSSRATMTGSSSRSGPRTAARGNTRLRTGSRPARTADPPAFTPDGAACTSRLATRRGGCVASSTRTPSRSRVPAPAHVQLPPAPRGPRCVTGFASPARNAAQPQTARPRPTASPPARHAPADSRATRATRPAGPAAWPPPLAARTPTAAPSPPTAG
jgi:hypothetical protein